MAASNSLTPEQRILRARLAAHVKHAKHDSRESTRAAREALEQRFLDEVDPDRELPEAERLRRAEHAKSAYMARLAFESSRKRSAKKYAKRKARHAREPKPVAEVETHEPVSDEPFPATRLRRSVPFQDNEALNAETQGPSSGL